MEPGARAAVSLQHKRRTSMHVAFIAVGLACAFGIVPGSACADHQAADKSGSCIGRERTPETTGQKQPQGWTGPLETRSGGAPPESPQGQSPPGMQPAPEGSSKTTVAPDKSK